MILNGTDKTVQHSTDFLCLVVQARIVGSLHKTDASRDFELDLQLTLRPWRDVEMMGEYLFALAPLALADVRQIRRHVAFASTQIAPARGMSWSRDKHPRQVSWLPAKPSDCRTSYQCASQ